MKNDIQQFVPQDVCLACDGCCRFKESSSEWRPKVARQEIVDAPQQGLAEKILSRDRIDADGRVKTAHTHGQCVCSFFNPDDNTCGIYSSRPFDCRLYPFVMVRDAGRVSVCVHLNCPFIQEKRNGREFSEYVDYLKEYFAGDDLIRFFSQNPDLAGDYREYRDELEHMFYLADLT